MCIVKHTHTRVYTPTCSHWSLKNSNKGTLIFSDTYFCKVWIFSNVYFCKQKTINIYLKKTFKAYRKNLIKVRLEIPESGCKNIEIINPRIKDNHLKKDSNHHLTAYYVVGTYIISLSLHLFYRWGNRRQILI